MQGGSAPPSPWLAPSVTLVLEELCLCLLVKAYLRLDVLIERHVRRFAVPGLCVRILLEVHVAVADED